MTPSVAADAPERRQLRNVCVWANGMVMAFDQFGKQMPYYQGSKEDVWYRVQRDKTPLTIIEGDANPLQWSPLTGD